MNEIELLVVVTLATGLMWIPYIIERIYQQGLVATVGYPEASPPVSGWAQRAQKAHRNAVENLVVFGVLLLAVAVTGANSEVSLLAAQIYVIARAAHYLCYLLAIRWFRTLAFFAGFVAQVMLAFCIFS